MFKGVGLSGKKEFAGTREGVDERVLGNMYVQGSIQVNNRVACNTLDVANSWTLSDQTTKTGIPTLTTDAAERTIHITDVVTPVSAYQLLRQVPIHQYYLTDDKHRRKNYGVYAQELAAVCPSLVSKTDCMRVDYNSVFALACAVASGAFQRTCELESALNKSGARVNALERELAKAEERTRRLERTLQDVQVGLQRVTLEVRAQGARQEPDMPLPETYAFQSGI
jgi:hypothetical protein